MISNDSYITIEMFNNGIHEIKAEFQQFRDEFKAEIKVVEDQLMLQNAKIDWLQHSVYWGFAIIGIVIALISIIPSKKETASHTSEWSERDLRSLIREEIAMAQNVANINS